MNDPRSVVKRALITEKGTALRELRNQYHFEVARDANKIEIKQAVEDLFNDQKIVVVAVNTINVRGKVRQRSRGRTRVEGRSPSWKKAIVTLAEGQSIKGLFEGV